MNSKKVKSSKFFDWPEKCTKEQTKDIDAFQWAIKRLPSFLNFPSHCTPEQQKAIDIIQKYIKSAAAHNDKETADKGEESKASQAKPPSSR